MRFWGDFSKYFLFDFTPFHLGAVFKIFSHILVKSYHSITNPLLDYYSVATTFSQFFRRAKKQVLSETILMIA
jgi:hypothetical protein